MALALLLVVGGCGTMHSIVRDASVYGGTTSDAAAIVDGDKMAVTRVTAGIDLPFSLVMDTILLPYTVGIALSD